MPNLTLGYLTDVADAQLEAALWSSPDNDGEPMDANYTIFDFTPDARNRLAGDAVRFVAIAAPFIVGMDAGQVGHDLWLTRNHHGAGFWDRGLGSVGDTLTKLADSLGEVDLYITDDGQVDAA